MTELSPEDLLEMEPYEFENLVAHLFRKMGYRAEVTQRSRDGGIDVDVCLEHFGLSHRWAVQVKRYAGVVGVKEIREYSSIRYRDGVDGVVIVTTASFTKDALEEASKHNVKLIEGPLLVKMLDHYCPEIKGQSTKNEKMTREAQSEPVKGAILKRGESTFASEQVQVDKKKLTMIVTNKNIFLRKESGSLLTKNPEIYKRIPVKDIIGIHIQKRTIFLLIGQKDMQIIPIRIKNKSRLPDAMEKLRADYMRGEYLIRFQWDGKRFLILTNKRLAQIGQGEEADRQIKIKDIVGSKVAGAGLFKKKKLIVTQAGEKVHKHEIDVNDAQEWQKEIEKTVRVT